MRNELENSHYRQGYNAGLRDAVVKSLSGEATKAWNEERGRLEARIADFEASEVRLLTRIQELEKENKGLQAVIFKVIPACTRTGAQASENDKVGDVIAAHIDNQHARILELTKERDEALKVVDANWVQHQRVVAAEARVKELEKYEKVIQSLGGPAGDALRMVVGPDAGVTEASPPLPRVRHKKRGSTYAVLGELTMQVSHTGTYLPLCDDGSIFQKKRLIAEGDKVIVYQAEDKTLHGRFPDEFNDGRFEEVKP